MSQVGRLAAVQDQQQPSYEQVIESASRDRQRFTSRGSCLVPSACPYEQRTAILGLAHHLETAVRVCRAPVVHVCPVPPDARRICLTTWFTDALGNMDSLAVLLGFEAADRLAGVRVGS